MSKSTRISYVIMAVLLVFIGSKIFVADLMGWEKFPPEWSLGITFAILGAGVGYSLWKTGTPRPAPIVPMAESKTEA